MVEHTVSFTCPAYVLSSIMDHYLCACALFCCRSARPPDPRRAAQATRLKHTELCLEAQRSSYPAPLDDHLCAFIKFFSSPHLMRLTSGRGAAQRGAARHGASRAARRLGASSDVQRPCFCGPAFAAATRSIDACSSSLLFRPFPFPSFVAHVCTVVMNMPRGIIFACCAVFASLANTMAMAMA